MSPQHIEEAYQTMLQILGTRYLSVPGVGIHAWAYNFIWYTVVSF